MTKILTVELPRYTVETEPDHKSIGKVVDEVIKQNFAGQVIVVRGISSNQHPDKSDDELIETIKKTGTDRYDPERAGDRYENIDGKRIDLFAFRRKVTPSMELFKDISWGFYHGSKEIHGEPVRIDILTIYDATQLKAVVHQYEGRDDIKRDGYIFKNPDNKAAALLGIIKIV
ncbi:MAG TPA: hypothetical protein VHA05_01810 [Candidatus Saccharimonadales bacterium]|nr:hypothetical protein [Candidatus Saccharimonadales bacterium]